MNIDLCFLSSRSFGVSPGLICVTTFLFIRYSGGGT